MASAAATSDLLKSLRDAVNCSVCRDIFKDPVTLHCGHNFCRSCITQRWEGLKRNFPCPQCRKRFRKGNIRPNPQLEEIAKQVSAPAVKGSEGEKLCEEHEKPLKLFCEEHKKLICDGCVISQYHGEHSVLPIEDAVKTYKNKIHLKLRYFKKERERMLKCISNGEKKACSFLTQTETARKEIPSYFVQKHHILKEEEQRWMERLDEMDKNTLSCKNECFGKISNKISYFEKLISDMEEKCQQPVIKFLQDFESTLSSLDKAMKQQEEMDGPVSIAPAMEGNFHRFSKQFKVFKESLGINKVDMTLRKRLQDDSLIISEDERSVTCEMGFNRIVPSSYVLGSEGFTSGQHYWEVEVWREKDGGGWAVGVARESVTHKTPSDLTPEEGIWCVWMSQNTIHPSYWGPHDQTSVITLTQDMNLIIDISEASLDETPTTTPAPVVSAMTPVLAPTTTLGPMDPAATPDPMTLDTTRGPKVPASLSETFIKIRVCLDYERGWVTFCKVDNMALPITYCTSFIERIFPVFWLCSKGKSLRLCP
ncbi:hypothetical protein KIL84_004707 [Mauremys mutica]|uniref:Zinc finger protein RFP-like n=1 Tax=Mauremys mutica TaxID=74926 RepID=A0A9D3XQ70_9SAUR|nr:hypothetical protein KIL84_004707 [Mauremys mutica]